VTASRKPRNTIQSLHERLLGDVKNELRGARNYVLLDAPNHWNVGDHAIWLGARTLHSELGLRLIYTASIRSVDWTALAATGSDTPIVLQGGGNLGDLWPHHQEFRETVIDHHHDRRIIQMPQSVWFESRQALERARRSFESHPDLTLLIRDLRSYDFVRDHFDVPAVLCPDSALSLQLSRSSKPAVELQLVLRTDKERASQAMGADVEPPPVDWSGGGAAPMLSAAGIQQRLAVRGRAHQTLPGMTRALTASADSLSRFHLRRGVRLLEAGQVVISDRLHVHILCLLLGIPHVALDNSYRKVHGFINTWTRGFELVHTADSVAEAIELGRELAVPERS
jgi:exopolysaccharide biosynthesis predicted pyruvyltransferase EpsI